MACENVNWIPLAQASDQQVGSCKNDNEGHGFVTAGELLHYHGG
jgi:hypothetical protein